MIKLNFKIWLDGFEELGPTQAQEVLPWINNGPFATYKAKVSKDAKWNSNKTGIYRHRGDDSNRLLPVNIT